MGKMIIGLDLREIEGKLVDFAPREENQSSPELEELIALQNLQHHIAQPCSRELLRQYLADLKTLKSTSESPLIKKMAKESLYHGEKFYEHLIHTEQEPSSSVIR